jgi:hypothetical protein
LDLARAGQLRQLPFGEGLAAVHRERPVDDQFVDVFTAHSETTAEHHLPARARMPGNGRHQFHATHCQRLAPRPDGGDAEKVLA